MTMTPEKSPWPPRPEAWPDVMTEIEVCQYLRLDGRHETPATAKRSLRFIRRTQKLPSLGRLGSKMLFRKAAVDAWLAAREALAAKEKCPDCPLARSPGAAYDRDAQAAVEHDDRNHEPGNPSQQLRLRPRTRRGEQDWPRKAKE